MGKEKNCMKLLWDYETSMNNINFEKDANFLYCLSHNSACVCCNMFCACFKNLSTFNQIFSSDRGGITGNCIVVQPFILANVQCIK